MARKRINPDSLPEIARRLRAVRRVTKMTQREFAEEIGIPKNTWAGYESGKSRIPIDSVIILVRRYKISSDWVYMGITGGMFSGLLKELEAELAKDGGGQEDDPANENAA